MMTTGSTELGAVMKILSADGWQATDWGMKYEAHTE